MSTVAIYIDHDNLQEEREDSQRKQLVQSQNTISVVLSIFSPLSFIAGYNTTYTHTYILIFIYTLVYCQNTISVVLSIFSPLSFIAGYTIHK